MIRQSLLLVALVGSLGLSFLACSSSTPPPQTAVDELPPPPPEAPSLPKGHVWRHKVMEVMSPGLGAFLGRVDVQEDLRDGKFYGFRIMSLRGEPSFWKGADLRVGDVVTKVNGMPIGHHDEAYLAWRSLITASEIVVSYERVGVPATLRLVVHEDQEPAAPSAPAQAKSAVPAKP